MNGQQPLALMLDGRTHAGLECLAADAGLSLAAMAASLIHSGVQSRVAGHRSSLFDAFDGPTTAERKARIAAQAKKLADHFANEAKL